MADYFGDESPWGAGTTDQLDLRDEMATPWQATTNPFDVSAPSEPEPEPEDEAAAEEEDAPRGSGSGSGTGSGTGSSATPQAQVLQASTVLKPATARRQKKQRNGGLAMETVDATPLGDAVQRLDLQDVELRTAAPAEWAAPERAGAVAEAYPPAVGVDSGVSGSSSAASTAPRDAFSSAPAPQPLAEFHIDVGDPQRVGELTNTHTQFTITMRTDCASYEPKEACVQRRYREFVWLYKVLEHKHPGVVVPPPPEKQALGRFNEDVVKLRRHLLEQMLRKICAHRELYDDVDLQHFLTSTDFQEYLKTRLASETEPAPLPAAVQTDDPFEPAGVGFIGSLSGALLLSRGTEVDPWTAKKQQNLDAVEQQLQKLQKALGAAGAQRQAVGDSLLDLSNALRTLADVEPTRRLGGVLRLFAKAHARVAEVHARLRGHDLLTLEATVCEHARLVGSMRQAIAARQRVFTQAEAAASELERRQERLRRATGDKVQMFEEQVEQQAGKARDLHARAAEIAKKVDRELARVSTEQLQDFRNALELYMENAIEAQKECIEVWETFYSRCFTQEEA